MRREPRALPEVDGAFNSFAHSVEVRGLDDIAVGGQIICAQDVLAIVGAGHDYGGEAAESLDALDRFEHGESVVRTSEDFWLTFVELPPAGSAA